MESTRRAYQAKAQAGLLSLARIPDRPAAARCALQPRTDRRNSRRRCGAQRRSRPRSRRWSPMRRSAMAAWAGLPPASWKAWRASTSRPMAMASAMCTACSARRSTDGWQVELPETWLDARQSVGVRAARSAYEIGFGGQVDARARDRQRAAATLEAEREASWPSPMTRRSSAGAASASTRCGCGRRAPSTRSGSMPSTRRPYRRARREQQGRES